MNQEPEKPTPTRWRVISGAFEGRVFYGYHDHIKEGMISEVRIIDTGIDGRSYSAKDCFPHGKQVVEPADPGEFKYFKFDKQTAVIIGNMLSMFCEQAKAETKNEKQNLAICRQKFLEFIQQFNAQLDAEQIAEILTDLEAERIRKQNKPDLILQPERSKIILLKHD